MPAPDKQIVIERLQKLLIQTETFERQDSSFRRTAAFDLWLSDVESWLQKGSPHIDEQRNEFQSLRFAPVSYYSAPHRNQFEESWRSGLRKARHFINRAIENLANDWATPSANAEAVANHAPSGLTIINQNIQYNSLTVRAVLEEIAREIEAKDQSKGKSLKRTIDKVAENPTTRTVLETILGVALKHIPGS